MRSDTCDDENNNRVYIFTEEVDFNKFQSSFKKNPSINPKVLNIIRTIFENQGPKVAKRGLIIRFLRELKTNEENMKLLSRSKMKNFP